MGRPVIDLGQGLWINGYIEDLEKLRKKYDRTDDRFDIGEGYIIIREPKAIGITYYFERYNKRILKTSVGRNFISRTAGEVVKGVTNGVTAGMANTIIQFMVNDPRIKNKKTISELNHLLKDYVKQYKEECKSSSPY